MEIELPNGQIAEFPDDMPHEGASISFSYEIRDPIH
jgi:hypothetical protein